MKAQETQRQRVFVVWLSGPLAVVLGLAAHLAAQLSPAPGHSMELMLDGHVAGALLTVLVLTQSAAVIRWLRRQLWRVAGPRPGLPGPPVDSGH